MTMSTWPESMNDSRFAEMVSVQVMPSSGMPSAPAMILPISTSKPSGLPSGPTRPNSGWSNLVPMVIEPASASSAIVEPSGKSPAATSETSGVVSSPVSSDPPHAARARTAAAVRAIGPAVRVLIGLS
jgi:hypothetical protein